MSGGAIVAKKDYTVFIKNVEVSVRMEGYTVTPKCAIGASRYSAAKPQQTSA